MNAELQYIAFVGPRIGFITPSVVFATPSVLTQSSSTDFAIESVLETMKTVPSATRSRFWVR